MAPISHLFLQGGITKRDWFSLRLRGEEEGGRDEPQQEV